MGIEPKNKFFYVLLYLYFVRSGLAYPANKYLGGTGNGGYYWSSTPYSNGTNAYYIYFGTGTTMYPSDYGYGRYLGISLRCLAR